MRKLKNWGESTREIASTAEVFAIEKILPKLGFSELYHASSFNRFVPFDTIATYGMQRVLIDVTTGASKSVMHNFAHPIAEALRLPLYILFIRPDFSKYQLTLCTGAKTVQTHLSELVPIE
jgi:hypothetical protein